MINRKLLLILSFFSISEVVAQTPGTPSVSTDVSRSTSFSSQGSSPGNISSTDLFTGTANINIPIQDYSVDGLNLGVSLGYCARGIKVDEIASSIGLGWNLNAGGYIQRTTFGLEDEAAIHTIPNNKANWGIWVNANQKPSSGPDTVDLDKQYDLFTAVFGGRTVSFMIRMKHDVQSWFDISIPIVVTNPKSELKIELMNENTLIGTDVISPGFDVSKLRFKITDEKGNQYFFEKHDTEFGKKFEWESTTTTTYDATTKWWLSKIITYTGQGIEYSYSSDNVSYKQYHNQEISENYYYDLTVGNNNTRHDADIPVVYKDEDIIWTGQMQKITQIKYNDNTIVDFIYTSGTSRCDLPGFPVLSEININSHDASNIGNKIAFKFNYAYFKTGAGEVAFESTCSGIDLNYRLKLKSIDRIVNGDNAHKELYYAFDYDNTQLPARLSWSQDFYGYYNGKIPETLDYLDINNNNTVYHLNYYIPKHNFSWSAPSSPPGYTSFNDDYGVDKTPDSIYMKACVLNKITNGMNGVIELYFKKHVLSNSPVEEPGSPVSNEIMSTNSYDGLCIQKIVFKDGISNDHTYSIRYSFENGLRFFKDLYYWYPIAFASSINGPLILQKRWNNNMVSPVDYFNGSNHGYSDVTEIKEHGTEMLSKNYTHFSNLINEESNTGRDIGSTKLINNKQTIFHVTYPRSMMRQYEMGLPLNTKSYFGNTLISETQNTYISSYQSASAGVPNVPSEGPFQNSYCFRCLDLYPVSAGFTWANCTTLGGGGNINVFDNSKRLLSSSTTIDHSGIQQKQFTKNYAYDTRDNITTVSWVDSKGQPFQKQYQYVYNFIGNPYTDAANQNIVEETVFQSTSTNPQALFLKDVVFVGNNSTSPFLFPTVKSRKISYDGGYYGSQVTTDKEYTFNDKANVIQTKYNEQEVYASSIWDSYFGKKIAEVSNAKYVDIAYTSFENLNRSDVTDYDKGNWQFDISKAKPCSTATTKPMTGKYYYDITTSPITSKNNLAQGKPYIISFWADYDVYVQLISQQYGPTGGITLTKHPDEINNMHLYSAVFTPTYGDQKVQIYSGSTLFSNAGVIDEVRLRPLGSTMVTYTYEPLFGLSSTCDDRNNITYQEYDAQGRPAIVRNTKGEIMSQTQYVVQGSDN